MYSHSFHAKLIWFQEKKTFNFSLCWHCFGWSCSDGPNMCGETGRNSKGDWRCTLITKINNCMIDGNERKPRASILPYPLNLRWCGRSRCHFSFLALLPREAARTLRQEGAQGFPLGCENSIVRNKEWVSEGIRLYLLSVKQPGAGKNVHGTIKKWSRTKKEKKSL